jgi:hypothetical protein
MKTINTERNDRNLQNAPAAPEGSELVAQTRSSSITRPQLELGLAGGASCRSTNRQRRLSRANWWFQRMRKVVDLACDWTPAPQPRPQQIWFENVRSEHALAPRLEERQVCE